MSYELAEENEPIAAEWLPNQGARVFVSYKGARYSREIPRNGYVTHSEAGALLRVRRETVWRWVQAGKLEAHEIRGIQVVSLSELRQFGIANKYLVPVVGPVYRRGIRR